MKKTKVFITISGVINLILALVDVLIIIFPNGHMFEYCAKLVSQDRWLDIEIFYRLFELIVLVTMSQYYCIKVFRQTPKGNSFRPVAIVVLIIIALRIILRQSIAHRFSVISVLGEY